MKKCDKENETSSYSPRLLFDCDYLHNCGSKSFAKLERRNLNFGQNSGGVESSEEFENVFWILIAFRYVSNLKRGSFSVLFF